MSEGPSSQHRRERDIFAEVREIVDPKERSVRLTQLCQGDPDLLRRLRELLAARDRAEPLFTTLELPTANRTDRPSRNTPLSQGVPTDVPGTIIGRYRLGPPLGEGGFGRVYRADQLEPVQRPVALKILKPGVNTTEIIARFEAERQALALMDHPHVAHVLDAGTTPPPDQRPFFVMELVDGEPITDYCDHHHLNLRDRIALLVPVCNAVQHAHQKGIIHRDLKPSNILVAKRDDHPHPMVIDFGIAKAMEAPLTDNAQLTRIDQLIGTPAYMSPEQATFGSRDVDTRSDVYALGVVLYELLTGQTPFSAEQLRQSGPAGMQRILLEEEPPAPSNLVRVTPEPGPATSRGADPVTLAQMLRGELDWIVLKALEKERNRRYPTANALARDLDRYLTDEPVQARPPSAAYLTQKFIRRHRHAAFAALGIVVALIAGLLLATVGFLRAREERNRAQSAETRASAEALYARRIAYASDMNLVRHALDNSNLGLAQQILKRNQPPAGQIDLRGWEWRYLQNACRNDAVFTLGSHTHAITSLTSDRSGHWLASASLDGCVKLWDLTTRSLVTTLPAAGSQIALAPEASRLAASNPQVGVQLWDVATQASRSWLSADTALTDLLFNPGKPTLIGAGESGHLFVWDLASQSLLARATVTPSSGLHTGDLTLAYQGNWLVYGDSAGHVHRLDADDLHTFNNWQAHDQSITALTLSPDDTTLATAAGFTDRTVRLWDPFTAALRGTLDGHRAWISALDFSPDGQTLASAGADQTIRLWDTQALQLQTTLRGHLQEVWALRFLPDNRTLASGDKDGTLHLWQRPAADAHSAVTRLPLHQTAFGQQAGTLLGLDANGSVQRVELVGLAPPEVLPALGLNHRLLAFSPQTTVAAVADEDGLVRVWNLTAATTPRKPTALAVIPNLSHLLFTPDGNRLITIGNSHLVQLYDSASWQPVSLWDSGENALGAIAISPDAALLASGGNGLTFYDLNSGQPLAEIQSHRQSTDAVAFSPDGRTLATGSQEGLAKVWDVATRTQLAELHGHLLGVHAVAFSPDGQRLATGSVSSEAVKLWDLTTGQEVLTLEWPGELVRSLAFSPDGTTLLAANLDSAVRLWQAPRQATPD